MSPVWTILILTIGERTDSFQRLLNNLLPQVEKVQGAVTVEALWNNGERSLARLRQDMMEYATATYTCFVDDDDQVADDYVAKILPLLDGEVDMIGFAAKAWLDGQPYPPVVVSTKHADAWVDTDQTIFRDISVISPIRRELIMQHADFCKGVGYEDRVWAAQLRGHIRTEVYLGEVMYFYSASTSDGFTHRKRPPVKGQARLEVDHPYFTYHPGSSV